LVGAPRFELPEQTIGDLAAEPLGIVRHYDDLHRICRARAESLDVSRSTIDEAGGFTPGYAGKLLSPRPIKHLSYLSLGLMLGALGLKLLVVEDSEALARVQRRLVKRQFKTSVQHWRQKRAAEAMLPTETAETRPQVERGTEWARAMNARRAKRTSKAERKKIAKVAARERWKRTG
jgi:hypothetical protein